MISDRTILHLTANATANGNTINAMALRAVSVQITGAFVGTIIFEGTVDLQNWVAVQTQNLTSGVIGTTASEPGIYCGSIAGLVQFRARISAYTSGTINVVAYTTDKEPIDFELSGLIVAGANTGVKGLRVYGGPTDPISDIPVQVDYAHHQVHEGETYSHITRVASLGQNASQDIYVMVPNLTPTIRTPHFAFEVIADGSCDVYLYESPTVSANGTQKTPFNRNRNSSNAAQTAIYETPTVTNVGTQLWAGAITASKNASGGNDRSVDEGGLKANTNYLVRVTAAQSGTKVIIRLNFYEDLGV